MPESIPKTDQERTSLYLLTCCYFLAALFGLGLIFSRSKIGFIIVTLLLNNTITMFVASDSRRRGRTIPAGMLWLIFFTWPLTLPYFYGRTRGWKGSLKAVLIVVSIYVVWNGFYVAGFYGLVYRADHLYRAWEYEKAVKVYNRLAEIDQASEWVAQNRAASVSLIEQRAYQLHAAQQYKKAIEIYDKLLAIDPSNQWAAKNRNLAILATQPK